MTEVELQELGGMIAGRVALSTKEVLTFDEACAYMGVSKSWLYKKTMMGSVPHYKPCGKLIFFNRKEVEQWLQRNHIGDING